MSHTKVLVKVLIVNFLLLFGYVIFDIVEMGNLSKHFLISPLTQEENPRPSKKDEYTSALTEEISKLRSELSSDATVIEELKKKIEDMIHINETHTQEDLKREQERIQLKNLLTEQQSSHQNENINGTSETVINIELEHNVFEPYEICFHLPKPSFTATYLWSQHISKVLEASKYPTQSALDNDKSMDMMDHLLRNVLTPERFRRAIRHLPTFRHESVRNVFQIIERRIQDPQNHPPLRVAIFGGSVTIGRGCDETKNRMQDYDCAWPRRFEILVNQFFQKDVIKVYNLGIGGTASGTATNIIEYWMYNDNDLATNGPDVIINSYSTNDSLPPWVGIGRIQMSTHDVIKMTSDAQRTSIQDFLRTALTSKTSCEMQPLVLHMDDSLGPQQEQVLGEMSYISVLTQLGKWYDTGVVSYPEVVRDIVYKNKSDRIFFNEKDVHYGHFAHQTIAWSLGFASIELLSNYCDDEYRKRAEETLKSSLPDHANDNETTISNLSQKHHRRPALPPPLTESLLWKNVTEEFQLSMTFEDEEKLKLNCSDIISSNERNPCEVAWISTPGGFGVGHINNFMKQYSENNKGWTTENNMAAGWSNKIGWTANEPNATFSLRFENVSKDLNSLTVAHLISYGEKWEGSLAKFVGIDSTGSQIFSQYISGVHNVTASPTVTTKIMFTRTIKKGEDLKMKVDLVSGMTFKVMGLMLCTF